jgi:AhpD family alkylhydroperoxidase
MPVSDHPARRDTSVDRVRLGAYARSMTEPVFDFAADRKHTATYKRETPDILRAYAAFEDTVFAAEGRELPLKHRELIAFAVAVTTQCVYCIETHSTAAVKAGATEGELAESAWVATAIRAGGGFAHGRLGFKFAGHAH